MSRFVKFKQNNNSPKFETTCKLNMFLFENKTISNYRSINLKHEPKFETSADGNISKIALIELTNSDCQVQS